MDNLSVYFKQLIKDVRAVYAGKLTYAENWDCYADVPFWSDLDYIGMDAYFPIAEGSNPSEQELEEGWSNLEQEFAADYMQRLGQFFAR